VNKVVYIKAHFKSKGKKVAHEAHSGETTRQRKPTECLSCEIDDYRLATDLGKAIQQLNSEGYEVVSVSEVTSGRFHCRTAGGTDPENPFPNGGQKVGNGCSYTEGILIVARKKCD
jgi:hypothetical protein